MKYRTKECRECGAEFEPRSGAQLRCDNHGPREWPEGPDPVPEDFTVPEALEVTDRPYWANRERRVRLALKLGRTAIRAGERRLAWSYVVYADAVARGVTEPSEDRVRRAFGHSFGKVPEDVRRI